MDLQPVQPNPSLSVSFFSNRQSLLLIVVFLLLFTVTFLIPQALPQKAGIHYPIDLEAIIYPNQLWQERVVRLAGEISQEKDSSKQFQLHSEIFQTLVVIYTVDHNAKSRNYAEQLASFVAKQFSEQYKNRDFLIPCLDSQCGIASYPTEIEKIKADLDGIGSFDSAVLKSILNKFEAAALTDDANNQWSSYFNAFLELKSEAKRTNDVMITQVAVKLREFLKNEYAANYQVVESLRPNDLEV